MGPISIEEQVTKELPYFASVKFGQDFPSELGLKFAK
jgi:hypothetical protein